MNASQAGDWPIIQTYDFTVGTVEIVLEQAGANVTVLLEYDNLEDFSYIELDRSSGPPSAEIHMTIYDGQLNIDPTAEETITFGTTAGTVMPGDDANSSDDFLADNGFGDNGVLLITDNATNVDFTVTADDTVATDLFLTFTETGANTGIWVNTDANDDSNFELLSAAERGTTVTIDYNDSPQSYLVATSTGSIDMDVSSVGDEWNSGESMTVTLVDGDRNLNTASDETFDFSNTQIPTIVMGSPVSASTTDPSRLFAATFSGGTEILESGSGNGITIADIVAIASTKNVVAVDVSDCTGATGWTLNSSDSWVIASDSTSTSSVKSFITTSMTSSDTIELGLTGGGASATCNVAVDFMSFGEGVNNAVYRFLLEETDDNTGVFEGSVEYIMMNQLNSQLVGDIDDIATNSDSITMILAADHTGTSAPRIIYSDTDSDGQTTGIADQADANTHDGVVSFDSDNYKVADTVTVTVVDMDLNTDSDLIDVYTVSSSDDKVGDGTNVVLDFSFGGNNFIGCTVIASGSGVVETTDGLDDTGFTLTESGIASGIFSGTFQIPANACTASDANQSTTGLDFEANYTDYLDASGNEIEVGAEATITANSGSVTLDRQVYPVPWEAGDFKDQADVNIAAGSIVVTISVTDEDYNTSPIGEDQIASGAVVLKAYRGTDSVVIDSTLTLVETTADSGVFEVEVTIAATVTIDGTELKQGDILTAEYTDPTDASGNEYLNTDSSTLDLRTGSLTSDKSVYVRGTDAIVSIHDPDLNLDSGTVESYILDLVEWDSDAGTVNLSNSAFSADPSLFRETGENTGVFQTVISIPSTIGSTDLEAGEEIDLEYVDHGTSGESNYSTTSTEDIGLTIYTSNFGATIELDKKVYTWTDRVFVNITAPDHNEDSALVEEIGGDSTLTAQTRSSELTNYKLVETGPDTGIFWGEITLIGFAHDADGDSTTGSAGGTDGNEGPTNTQVSTAAGPTNGYLEATDKDGITISFEYSDDATVVSSSLIRWNIAEISFSETAYLANASAIVSVTDIDMNLNPDTVENFTIELWSDSDSGGIDLTITETNESTGVFEGVVYFTTTDASSGHTLRVSEGDTITASYEDNTLPEPYSSTDELEINSVAVIGTIIPPLERAPASNLRAVDAFGGDVNVVSIDQQVLLQANIANGSDDEQPFAYLVQVQNDIGVTVSLAWITGTLSGGQSFSPALSWIPTESGSYTATAFVWESVNNPTALSASISTTITVE